MTQKRFITIPAALLACLLWLGAAQARVITDMAGRRVTVPEHIERVYATAPPATYMVYAVGPELLAGLNSPPPEAGRPFLDPRLWRLPVLGGWFGQGRMANREALLKARPQVVISFRWRSLAVQWKIEETMASLDLPVVGLVVDGPADYPAAFRFLGRLLDRRERCEALAAYAERTLAAMARLRRELPPAERLVVYYAEGPRGLQTECDRSFHAELINLCGGINPHRCLARTIYGMDRISLEQVLTYDPQAMVIQKKGFYEDVARDVRWRGVRAVADGRLYLVPFLPLNWFDRPPTFMGLLGAHWLAHRLYPDRYPLDLAAETMGFFRLFLGKELDRPAAERLLAP